MGACISQTRHDVASILCTYTLDFMFAHQFIQVKCTRPSRSPEIIICYALLPGVVETVVNVISIVVVACAPAFCVCKPLNAILCAPFMRHTVSDTTLWYLNVLERFRRTFQQAQNTFYSMRVEHTSINLYAYELHERARVYIL